MSIHDGELTCQEVVELVTEYLENVLLPETRKRLEEHVDNCPGCASYIEQIQLTIGMLRQLADEPVFPTMKQELLKRFRTGRRMRRHRGQILHDAAPHHELFYSI